MHIYVAQVDQMGQHMGAGHKPRSRVIFLSLTRLMTSRLHCKMLHVDWDLQMSTVGKCIYTDASLVGGTCKMCSCRCLDTALFSVEGQNTDYAAYNRLTNTSGGCWRCGWKQECLDVSDRLRHSAVWRGAAVVVSCY